MPRIDPQQLLNCLSVLLSSSGGISSKDEVERLSNLMTKFSKKLVSKCVYVLILRSTETVLLGAFMGVNGWQLIQRWLQEAIYNSNWALTYELLDLLLVTPVDVQRLKTNNIPKLVKSLTKKEDHEGIHQLSNKLVQQWLNIVKRETKSDGTNQEQQVESSVPTPVQVVEVPIVEAHQTVDATDAPAEPSACETPVNAQKTFYKLTVRGGKQIFSKVEPEEANYTVVENAIIEEVAAEESAEKKQLDIVDKKKERSNHDRSKRRSTSSSSKSSRSSSKDKSRDKSSKEKGSRDKDKDRKDKSKDKERTRSNGSVKQSSGGSSSAKKETKEKQAEKDKDTLAKLLPQSVLKLPKIPKKASSSDDKNKDRKEIKKEETKKPSISIEVRKNNEERPKTVKVFNSKMRSTGLEEVPKPPPPRGSKKVSTSLPPVPVKRPSPIRDAFPPEKKSRTEPLERPGAIKLIPPKPKPSVLQESDLFMDVLAASATSKKEPKKRKRRASVSKDSSGSPPPSPSVATIASSPAGFKNITPPKFYQDTLETDESKSEAPVKENDVKVKTEVKNEYVAEEAAERSVTPVDTKQDVEPLAKLTGVDENGLKGVLLYGKKRGPKKSIKWKPDAELVNIQFFELDETERVNVTKTFMDMAKMELSGEREALQMSRKLPSEDLMDSQTTWRIPFYIDLPKLLAEPGCKSLEKDIQFAREKTVLQALYFNKIMLSDTLAEPDPETHQMTDPLIIPVSDPENNADKDYRNTPWPEPKGSPPPSANAPSEGPVFPSVQGPFQNFGMGPPPGFQGMPPFGGPGYIAPNMVGGDWNPMNMNANQMIPPNMPPPDMMNQGPMIPNMFPPNPDNFNPMMNDNNGYPPQFNQHGPGMYPPNNFNMNRGGRGGGFRRGGGGGPWLRMNGPSPGGWNNQNRGGGGNRGGRVCKNIKNHGYCRNRDSCPFLHPNN